IVISHISIPIPWHRRKDRSAGPLMFAGSKRTDKHLLRPASESRLFIWRKVHGEADAPRSCPRAEMVVRHSQPFAWRDKFGRNRRHLFGRRVAGQFSRHIWFRSIWPQFFRSMTIIASA